MGICIMKKKIALALSAALSISLLGGCGGKNDKLLDKNDPVTVTIWHYYNGVQQTMLDDMITEFNETLGMEKGIIVEAFSKNTVNELSDSVLASINGEVGAEAPPDIFASYSETAYLVDKAGKLADISQYFTEEELAAYVPEYIQEGNFAGDGTLKIFPVAKSTEVMIVNKTDWDKFAAASGAKIEDLSTWEGLVEVSEKYYNYTDGLTPDIENDGKAFYGRDSMANYVVIGAKQLGAPFVKRSESGEIVSSSDKAAVRRLWDCYYVPYLNGYFTANSRFRSDDAKTGAIIALICSTSGAAYQPFEVTLDDDTSYPIENMVIPVPNFSGTSPVIVQQGAGLCIVKSDPAVEYASSVFLKWFTETDRNIEFSINSGYLPVKEEANDFEKMKAVAESYTTNQVVLDTLKVAVDEVNNYELYIAPPADNTIAVRNFLNTYMQTSAADDRAAAYDRIAAGEDRAAVIASYTDDAAFEKWYSGFEAEFNSAAGN